LVHFELLLGSKFPPNATKNREKERERKNETEKKIRKRKTGKILQADTIEVCPCPPPEFLLKTLLVNLNCHKFPGFRFCCIP